MGSCEATPELSRSSPNVLHSPEGDTAGRFRRSDTPEQKRERGPPGLVRPDPALTFTQKVTSASPSCQSLALKIVFFL